MKEKPLHATGLVNRAVHALLQRSPFREKSSPELSDSYRRTARFLGRIDTPLMRKIVVYSLIVGSGLAAVALTYPIIATAVKASNVLTKGAVSPNTSACIGACFASMLFGGGFEIANRKYKVLDKCFNIIRSLRGSYRAAAINESQKIPTVTPLNLCRDSDPTPPTV